MIHLMTILAVAGALVLTKDNIPQIVREMTIEEKAALLVGNGNTAFDGRGNTANLVPGAAGTTQPIDRFGIPAIVMADGPAGVRISKRPSLMYPCETLLASTWNAPLVESVGQCLGQEVREFGVDILLAPAANIHRNPLCGRNFEYLSEDPLLAGYMAAAIIRGIQSNGVGTALKHFAANNEETNRLGCDSRVDEQALREIYLRNFQIAVRESNPWTIMTSYNFLNGVYTSESPDLLRTMLRDEWGYSGCVMTDWGGGYSAARQIAAWNDMIQPGSDRAYNEIVAAAHDGSLSQADLDSCVVHVLKLIVRTPRYAGYKYSNAPDLDYHRAVAREAAAEGSVLLKNNKSTLPLRAGENVAVFGSGSYALIYGGSGSGDVYNSSYVNLTDGLRGAGFTLNEAADSYYAGFMKTEERRLTIKNKNLAWYVPKVRPMEAVPYNMISAAASSASSALITFSRGASEGRDRHPDELKLSVAEHTLLAAVADAFHSQGKKVTVLLNIPAPIDVESWAYMADAILVCWLPGASAGNAVADILSGKVNPSGRLPMTFLKDYYDDPTNGNFPLMAAATPHNFSYYRYFQGEKYCDIKNIDWINYEEGLFYGYRYFTSNRKGREAYPFGYGLSYTSFKYSGMSVRDNSDGSVSVDVQVKNTGAVAGKDVVEVYVSYPVKNRPVRELKGYVKTPLMQPGEIKTVTVCIKNEDLAIYNESAACWEVPAGKLTFQVCSDAETPVLSKKLAIPSGWFTRQAHDLFNPDGPLFLR